MIKDFFPPRPESRPTIYAYEDTNPQYANLPTVLITARGQKGIRAEAALAGETKTTGQRQAIRM